jgi:hypothetical protein
MDGNGYDSQATYITTIKQHMLLAIVNTISILFVVC